MANTNKTTVALGIKAYSFHDPVLGITLAKGETVELSPRQLLSKRIQQALNAGHLRIVQSKEVEKYTEAELEKTYKKIIKAFERGKTVKKISKNYNLDEIKLIANRHSIQADANDTVETLVQALVEDVDNN